MSGFEAGSRAGSGANFEAACRRFGATAGDGDLARATLDLRRRWESPSRGYHDLRHLDEVLTNLGRLGAATAEPVLAAWFHDAVYAGRPGDDEQASAALAVDMLTGLGVGSGAAERVRFLVLVTADHRPPPDDDAAAALCDADLAILAAAPDRYAAYVAGVRSEYPHLDDAAFRVGRAAVLRELAGRDPLFCTALGHALWDADARRNLTDELASLSSQEHL